MSFPSSDRILKMRLSSFPLCLLLHTHTQMWRDTEREREGEVEWKREGDNSWAFSFWVFMFILVPLLFISLSVAPLFYLYASFSRLPALPCRASFRLSLPLPLRALLLFVPLLLSVRFSFEFSHIHFISCAQARPSAAAVSQQSCCLSLAPSPPPLSLSVSPAISFLPATRLALCKCAWIMIVARFSKTVFRGLFPAEFLLLLLLRILWIHTRAACGARSAPLCPNSPPPTAPLLLQVQQQLGN